MCCEALLDKGVFGSKTVYVALGELPDGTHHFGAVERADRRCQVQAQAPKRPQRPRREDVLNAVVERLTGLADAIALSAGVRWVRNNTNVLDSLHERLRMITKTCGHFPKDEADQDLRRLERQHLRAKTTRSVHEWHEAKNPFAIFRGTALRIARPDPLPYTQKS